MEPTYIPGKAKRRNLGRSTLMIKMGLRGAPESPSAGLGSNPEGFWQEEGALHTDVSFLALWPSLFQTVIPLAGGQANVCNQAATDPFCFPSISHLSSSLSCHHCLLAEHTILGTRPMRKVFHIHAPLAFPVKCEDGFLLELLSTGLVTCVEKE